MFARDDGAVHIWAGGRDKPEQVLVGHQSDVKCVDWHPHRALIASGSRDSSLILWDPKQGKSVRYAYSIGQRKLGDFSSVLSLVV
jgi:WD40 repeat protein